jgi:hypothetical protein
MRKDFKRLAALALLMGALGIWVWTRRQPLPWSAVEKARAALERARVEAAAEPELARAVAAEELLERRLAEAGAARLPIVGTYLPR